MFQEVSSGGKTGLVVARAVLPRLFPGLRPRYQLDGPGHQTQQLPACPMAPGQLSIVAPADLTGNERLAVQNSLVTTLALPQAPSPHLT